jgi:adenine-specific DNA-methyltransferase
MVKAHRVFPGNDKEVVYTSSDALSQGYVRVEEDALGLFDVSLTKQRGEAWTPRHVAAFLCRWAIRSSTDRVLDPGSGRGIFLFEAYRRLLGMGASVSKARSCLYGIEKNSESYEAMRANLAPLFGGQLPNIQEGDLFEATFPPMDAVIGNPPYVRRWWLQDVDRLREGIGERIGGVKLTRLTDLACYFIIRAGDFLKPGGRLALIVTDGWLDADYGAAFKEYLLSNFHLHAVAAFESRIFDGLLIRPVLLLAEKRARQAKASHRKRTLFALLRGPAIGLIRGKNLVLDRVQRVAVRSVSKVSADLRPEVAWTPYFTAPKNYFALVESGLTVPLRELAVSRIGLQTFAKPFFILKASEAESHCIEQKYLRPILVSSRQVRQSALTEDLKPEYVLLCCSKPETELRGTAALSYIRKWECRAIVARGRIGEVVGAQNLPRLRRARRVPWYNIHDEVERRGSWPILVPRRMFRKYLVVWNLAEWVVNENFIELMPREGALLEPLLAMLNSSFAEMAFRVNSHLYGGGVYNLNPGDVGAVPILDVRHLDSRSIKLLRTVYEEFARDNDPDRSELDSAISKVFKLPSSLHESLDDAVLELRAASSKIKSFQGQADFRMSG